MHRCTLSTIATYNTWTRDPGASNKVQIRKGDYVKEIKRSRSTVVCKLYKDNFVTSISISKHSFDKNFKKIENKRG